MLGQVPGRTAAEEGQKASQLAGGPAKGESCEKGVLGAF
jgi:hypothetical protein